MRYVHFAGLAFVLLSLASCARSNARSKLIGHWEMKDAKNNASIEFTSSGNVLLGGAASALPDWKVIALFQDFNLKPARDTFTYEVIDKDHVEIQADLTRLLEGLSAGGKSGSVNKADMAKLRPKQRLTFEVNENELTLTSENGKPAKFQRGG